MVPFFIFYFLIFSGTGLYGTFCTEISHPFVWKLIFKNVPFSAAHPVILCREVTTPRPNPDILG